MTERIGKGMTKGKGSPKERLVSPNYEKDIMFGEWRLENSGRAIVLEEPEGEEENHPGRRD